MIISTTVILPFYNHIDMTLQCLQHLLSCDDSPEVLVLIDDGSVEDSSRIHEFVSTYLNLKIDILRLPVNQGFIGAVNLGFQATTTEYVTLLNNDAIPLPGWLKALHDAMQAKPDIGAVGSKLLHPDGRIEESGREIDYTGAVVQLCAGMHRFDPAANTVKDVAYCSGASLHIRREALGEDLLWLLDPQYGVGYYGDADLCTRIRENGYKVLVQPLSEVVHLGGQTFGKGELREKQLAESQRVFRRRWISHLSREICRTDLTGHNTYLYVRGLSPQSKVICCTEDVHSVTIIILCWNHLNETMKTVDSVLAHTYMPYRLIMVDNMSTDGTRDYLLELQMSHSNVETVLLDQNYGFAGGMNAGLARATSEYVAVLNNDVQVTPGWMERMVVHLRRNPQLGIIGPTACNVSGLQNVPYDESTQTIVEHARLAFAENAGQLFITQRLVAFAWVMRRELLELVGGFDLRFGLGNFEDDDYCIRTLNSGYSAAVARDVFVFHKGSESWNVETWLRQMKSNRAILHDKWGSVFNDQNYWIVRTPKPYDKSRDFFPIVSTWKDIEAHLRGCMSTDKWNVALQLGLQAYVFGRLEIGSIVAAISALKLNNPNLSLRIVANTNTTAPSHEIEITKLSISLLSLHMLNEMSECRKLHLLSSESGYVLPPIPETHVDRENQLNDVIAALVDDLSISLS